MLSTLKKAIRSYRGSFYQQFQRFSFGSIQQFTPQELKNAEKYVEQNLRSRTWVTYMLASYIPQKLRPPFYSLHLLDLQLTKISQNARQPALALGKLQFWKESIFQIYSNKKPQPEPLTICLYHAIHNNPLTYGYFNRMIAVRSHEISNRTISTMSEMRKMADDSKGTLLALTLELLRIDITNEHIRQVVDYLGQAIGICQYIRRVPYSLRNNRFMLPEEILTKYNLTTKTIWNRVYGKPSEELFDGILQIASHAKKCYQMAVKVFNQNPQSFPEQSFRAFLRGVDIEYYLQNLQKYNFNIFDQNLNNTSPIKLPYRVYKAAKAKKFSYGMDIKR